MLNEAFRYANADTQTHFRVLDVMPFSAAGADPESRALQTRLPFFTSNGGGAA